tara:strand:- start:10386 stop:10595 length:210 start_codon:yes stop_codon:yes gene_type:complete
MIRDIFKAEKTEQVVTEILLFTLVLLISTFILRYSWNRGLVKHVSILKPIDTFLDALILSIGLAAARGI